MCLVQVQVSYLHAATITTKKLFIKFLCWISQGNNIDALEGVSHLEDL